MRGLKTQDLVDVQDKYHNPLVKALSNSNLNMFDSQISQNNHPKYIHSAVNLLDVANEELIVTTAPMLVPPKRPPPPSSFPKMSSDPFETSPFDDPVPTIQITKDSAASLAFGFDDDFGKFSLNDKNNNSESLPPPQNNTVIPTRAPPLPPLPNKPEQAKVTTPPSHPVFTLFDDSFDPIPPPLPPKPATVPARPPPLPPMPTTQPLVPTSAQPKIPQRPTPPPPVPPLPAGRAANQNNSKTAAQKDLDLLGDPGDLPLPPSIQNHFN
jgi:hypothetical protein